MRDLIFTGLMWVNAFVAFYLFIWCMLFTMVGDRDFYLGSLGLSLTFSLISFVFAKLTDK